MSNKLEISEKVKKNKENKKMICQERYNQKKGSTPVTGTNTTPIIKKKAKIRVKTKTIGRFETLPR